MTGSFRYAGLLRPAIFCAAISAVAAGSWFHGHATAQALRLAEAPLSIGPHKLTAEVASDETTRNYGLMNRGSLPEDHGMLFVFDTVGRPCFWMKNTPLPLTIAFMDRHGIITDVLDMQPHSTESHCPSADILYALEMEQGWFQTRTIQPGDRVNALPRRQGH